MTPEALQTSQPESAKSTSWANRLRKKVLNALGLNHPDVPASRPAEDILKERPNLTQGNQFPQGWLNEGPKTPA